MDILIADQFEPDAVGALQALGCDVHLDPSLDGEGLGAALDDRRPQILIVRSTKVTAAMIGAAPGLKAIIRAGAGYDNIDTAAAGAAGVGVCNCPGMNAVAVAELTMAHLLCCDRRLPAQTAELRAGHWNKQQYAKARGLKGMHLGVVGVGAVGRQVIARARAFEMVVHAWSHFMTPDLAATLGVVDYGSTRERLDVMLPQCDAVTIHVSATDETRHLCNAPFFDAMREGAYFVNTSRGSVVDEPALIDAMRTRGIRAGLDVYADQPSERDAQWKPPLADAPGVCSMTHHIGASTDQAQSAVGDEVARIVEALMQEGRFLHCVNESSLVGADVG